MLGMAAPRVFVPSALAATTRGLLEAAAEVSGHGEAPCRLQSLDVRRFAEHLSLGPFKDCMTAAARYSLPAVESSDRNMQPQGRRPAACSPWTCAAS